MENKLRIAIIIGYFESSLGYQEGEIAKYLARLGHKVFVVTSDLVYPWKNTRHMLSFLRLDNRKYPLVKEEVDGYKIIRLKSTFEFKTMVIAAELRKVLKSLNPDLVIAFGIGQIFSIPAVYLKTHSNYKLFSVFGDNKLRREGYSILRKMMSIVRLTAVKKHLYRYVFKRTDRILANVPETADFFIDLAGKNSPICDKMRIFPLGFDPDIFFFDQKLRKKTRDKFDLKDNEVVIITAGKLDKSKKIEILMDAFSKLIQRKYKAKLAIVGTANNYYSHYLRSYACNLGIERICLFLPFLRRKRLAAIYNAADIGIWPVKPSITILEAMGTGLYMLLPRTGTTSHLLSKGITGFYFTHFTDLNMQLLMACEEYNKEKRVKRASFNTERFSYKVLVDILIQEYQSL